MVSTALPPALAALHDEVEKDVLFGPIAKPLSELVCIEIFAGSARLTAELSARGFDALAIDHAGNRHRQSAPVLQIDLTLKEDQDRLFLLLGNPRIVYVHIAMPCGTASKAREIPMPAWKLNGRPAPKPLRSLLHPAGLPTMDGVDKQRVLQANCLYTYILQVMHKSLDGHILHMRKPSEQLPLEFPRLS